MVKRMLIDATHPEETRVVVVNGTRLEELDVETSTKKQIKGNIYLAKVIRVEPSLQAAFVDYGGNRHGFLAFNEIHPDYFQIPVADRQALLAAQNALSQRYSNEQGDSDAPQSLDDPSGDVPQTVTAALLTDTDDQVGGDPSGEPVPFEPSDDLGGGSDGDGQEPEQYRSDHGGDDESRPPQAPEILGGDDASEQELARRRARLLRNYKIQEVIKRRQIMLVQVVKEERGNKGAALTTYLSLAGRYCVLMPNTARGGGVSRKIVNAVDRKRLKAIAQEMEVPEGMAVIVRTAGSERSKLEIKRDYEYLLRMWDTVRDLTLRSSAPTLVYEEASIIKRSIRDLYARDIDEVLVDGEEGYRLAKDYMRMLTPSHAKKVQPYRDPGMPMFHRYQVENQLDAMHSPVVQLRSGGYIVIGQTEALVAIDVNSGRATRERHIEETALKTNLEAADEVARQLRLRDLAGLIVIDFIDMEESRNNYAVERRLKDALKNDRARIQVGRISAFGLLELSRQRLRPSLQETAFSQCPHCAGTGLIRSVESSAMAVLRAIEEEGIRGRSSEVTVWVPTEIALYVLNQKREALAIIEQRYSFVVMLAADDTLIAPNWRMDRVKAEFPIGEARPALAAPPPRIEEDEEEAEADATDEAEIEGGDETEDEQGQSLAPGADNSAESQARRRRRRRRRGRGGAPTQLDLAAEGQDGAEGSDDAGVSEDQEGEGADDAGAELLADGQPTDGPPGETTEERARRRRRGRRGGRRRNRGAEGAEGERAPDGATAAEPVVLIPDHLSRDDVADVFEAAERAEEAALTARLAAAAQAASAVLTAAASNTDAEPDAVGSDAESTVVAQGDAETVDDNAPVAEAPTEETPAPKRRRASTRKKPEGEEAAAADVAVDAEAPAPKRRRAPARKKAEAAEAQPEAVTPEAVRPEAVTPESIPSEPVVAEPTAVEAMPEPVAEPEQEPEAAPAPVIIDEVPDGPPRKGWWNKLLS